VLVPIWDAAARRLRLPPFDPVLSGWHAFFMERLSRMEDAQLLAKFSTSPHHESPWFCDGEGRRAGLGALLTGAACLGLRSAWCDCLWHAFQPSGPTCGTCSWVGLQAVP
jgi:hypothetical protein